jgi:hypothetical protein
MFRAITGREYERTNKALFALARVEKWLRNPMIPIYRVADKLLGGPGLSFPISQS